MRLDTMDAKVWAEDWADAIAANPSIPTDEATMVAWFANAIMAGYSAGYRHRAEVEEQSRSG
jgi:hypothetical protein